MREVVYIEDNRGDVELLMEGIREAKVDVTLRVFAVADEARWYLQIRFEEGGLPPPHLLLISHNPHDPNRMQLIDFLQSIKALELVKVITLGLVEYSLEYSKIVSLQSVTIAQKPRSWDEVSEIVRLISS